MQWSALLQQQNSDVHSTPDDDDIMDAHDASQHLPSCVLSEIDDGVVPNNTNNINMISNGSRILGFAPQRSTGSLPSPGTTTPPAMTAPMIFMPAQQQSGGGSGSRSPQQQQQQQAPPHHQVVFLQQSSSLSSFTNSNTSQPQQCIQFVQLDAQQQPQYVVIQQQHQYNGNNNSPQQQQYHPMAMSLGSMQPQQHQYDPPAYQPFNGAQSLGAIQQPATCVCVQQQPQQQQQQPPTNYYVPAYYA
eukprot:PhM_4_TR7592/c3_g1_i1/m.83115